MDTPARHKSGDATGEINNVNTPITMPRIFVVLSRCILYCSV